MAGEQKRAIEEWRRQFRGEAQVRQDKDITDAEIAASNLVLWGDPGSNRVLARIAERLPVKWTAEGIVVGGKRYPADTHAPILIYPNPLNPKKYVVLNSGFTFREFDYLNNARQTPEIARLRGGGYHHSAGSAVSGQDRAGRLLQRGLEDCNESMAFCFGCVCPRRA